MTSAPSRQARSNGNDAGTLTPASYLPGFKITMITGKRLLLVSITAILCMPIAGARGDSLADAMRALDSDSISKALELSSERQSNPWLEVYRLHVRAEAFLSAGDTISAAERAVSALRLIYSGEADGHPEGGRLIDISVLCGGPEIITPFVSDDIPYRLDPHTLLLMGRHYLDLGDSSSARSYFNLAARRRPGVAAMGLLKDLAGDGSLAACGVSHETIASFASAAISAEDKLASRLLIEITGAAGEYEWLAEILKADMLAASGKKSKALSLYREVFSSKIYPVEGKKRALQRLAALQYRMKRYADASASYRTYGLYYPNDPLAEMSTDRSARLEVASGRWVSAVDTWRRIADSGPKTAIGREAILGMAVLLEKTGRKKEACAVLLDNLQGIRGRLRAAYLYWIVRTCGDEQLRSDHTLILNEESSRSFYARAIEEGPGFLDAEDERERMPSISMLETITRKSPFPGTGIVIDHPCVEAFRYFAAESRKMEAADCARAYIANLDDSEKEEKIGTLYDKAKASGLESICIELAVDYPGLFSGREDYIEYLYPFAYGSEIDEGVEIRSLPPELVLAVIREESRFDENVMSFAGAYGLMQIMPSTGEWIGGKIGRKDVNVSDLCDPGFNIAAGCWYLRFLLDRADESIVAALAAYNAGHGRMRSWKKKFRPQRDPLAALELIGPFETRQYVRRVLDSMAAYSRQTSHHRK